MLTKPSHSSDVQSVRPSPCILKQRFYYKSLQLESRTHFTSIEIEALLRIFDKIIDKYKSPMTKIVFKDILFNFFGLTNDLMMEKIFRTMTNGRNLMTHEDWVTGLDIYLRGTLSERANFAFMVYDHQKRGFLSKEDIQLYLKDITVHRIPDEDAEECQTDMLDMVFILLDQDKDGYISRTDFLKSVYAEPLLLQLLGDCLPSSNSALALNALIKQSGGREDDPV
ncbi:hypothetical protein P879_09931 [Paragonimus westermani]|uniref:EF-hand domain-containing protein n=1 Tax=Paragonimus westermani TaxID=34504 RepID=A0A8T0D9I6_9TREM|nr:hypothetical protein P879_09931 [Paragonimus westermani]